jgi:hypothetical protein
VDPDEIALGFEAVDLDAQWGLAGFARRSVEVELEVSERPHAFGPAGADQRGPSLVDIRDRREDRPGPRLEPFGRPGLDPVEQHRTEPAATVVRMHETPRLELALALGGDVGVPDDRRSRIRHDPRVHRQVESRRGPLVTEEVGVEVGLARLGEVVGQQHLGDPVEVVEGRGPDRVTVRD